MDFLDMIKGALLHDIGKFVMKAGRERGKNHQETGAGWLREFGVNENIAEFALRHHHCSRKHPRYEELDVFALPTNEILIVYEADNLSSGERPGKDQDETQWQPTVPLMSVFSKISHDHKKGKPVFKQCWHYHKLTTTGSLSFPGNLKEATSSYSPENYMKLLQSFEEDFAQIIPHLPVDVLLMVLEKYTSFIPSETQVVEGKPETNPDVSLFDHLKTTAAIAACMYRYLEETRADFHDELLKEQILDRRDERYLLVGGDFSGVQKFIYTISSKGALKTLRARSFFLELLTEHVITRILTGMNLPRTNVIYSGGGRFYLLAPNTPKAKSVLDKTAFEINGYLYDVFRGRLYLALDSVSFAGEDFLPRETPEQNIALLWGLLGERLKEKKNRKFMELIVKNPGAFWRPREPDKHYCAVCHGGASRLFPLEKPDNNEEPVEACSTCKSLFELGDNLLDVRYIAGVDSKPGGVPVIEIEDTFYALYADAGKVSSRESKIVYVINSWNVEDYRFNTPVQLFTGTYAARKDYGFKGFDDLGKEAMGADCIGVLRMDVDNLGKIFTQGLPEYDRTFSRLSTLSRSLTRFFKYHINEICKGNRVGDYSPLRLVPKHDDRKVTIVYSGGDDLFLVGAWDDITELAFDVAYCFRKYTGQNPDVTISGGVVVEDTKFPLYKLAELAGEAEEKAKDNGRDSISLFYKPSFDLTRDNRPVFTGTFKWDEAKNLVDEILRPAVKDLAELQDGGRRLVFKFSKGFIYRLLSVADVWRREGKLYLPRLAYILAREGERENLIKNDTWKTWKQKIYQINYIGQLHTAVKWMDLISRKGAAENGQ